MTSNNKVFLTEEGLEKLQNELEYLKTTKRPEVVKNLKEAKALGDLSENAEYDSARSEQAETEGRIKEIEQILDNYELVAAGDGKCVNVGSTVRILLVADNIEEVYTIVGKTEANPFDNKISNESELAKALLGNKVGKKVQVNGSDEKYEVKILEILK